MKSGSADNTVALPFDERGDSFVARTYTQTDGLAQNSVYSVHRNHDGTVWAGTVSGGLSRLKDGVFTNYSQAEGPVSNSVNSIVEGFDGKMWFATPSGLESLRRWTLDKSLCSSEACRHPT